MSHVTDGVNLAQKYRLPQRIIDFIREHHGRSLVKYFYITAQNNQQGESVNEADYRYPGPYPRSKETGILLLADSCEAAIRARRPANRDELNKYITQLINERISDGELDDSNLTLREVKIISEVFQQVLQGVHHPRIAYPTQESAPSGAEVRPAPPANSGETPTSTLTLENGKWKDQRLAADGSSSVAVMHILPIDEIM